MTIGDVSAGGMNDRQAIRELVESWAVWRDAGDWERFRTVWSDDGRMMATWFQGTADEFIRVSREGFERGVRILHFLGGSSIDVVGRPCDRADEDDDHAARAGARGRVRRRLHRALLRLPRAPRRPLGLVLRQPIYEQDRLTPVDPALRVELDRDALARFPVGYRHLAYLQEQQGFTVKPDMPGLVGPEVDALYASGARWLAGEPLDR